MCANTDEYLKEWTERNERRQTGILQFGGEDFIIYANVFSPDYNLTNSSSMALAFMPTLAGKGVLDIGTGSGILAIHAAKRGASHVLATDIDEVALKNARENIERHELSKQIVTNKSDLFQNVSGSFDFIIANLPIIDSAWTGMPPVKDILERFITHLPSRLNPGGSALLPFASFGDVSMLCKLIARSTLSWNRTEQIRFGITWYMFQAMM